MITSDAPVAVMKTSADATTSEPHDGQAVHRRLQRADRVDLGDQDDRALAAKGRHRTLADVAIAADDRGLAGEHHVGSAVNAVDK